MANELKKIEDLGELASHLSESKELIPTVDSEYGAVYALKNRQNKIVYIGKSLTFAGALGRISDHMISKRTFVYWSVALVLRSMLTEAETQMINRFKPQYNCTYNPNRKNLYTLIKEAITTMPKTFTANDVLKKLPNRFTRDSVVSTMSKVRNETSLFFTKEKLQGPGQCAIYERA
jgi:hypothetical protein